MLKSKKMDGKKALDINLSPGQSRVKKLLERFEKLETISIQNNSLLRDRLVLDRYSLF